MRQIYKYTKIIIVVCITGSCLYSCERKVVVRTQAVVCPQYNNADATVVQVTDQYFPPDHRYVKKDSRRYGAAWAEFLAFKYNIPLHVFEQESKGEAFEEFLKTGRGGASVYFPSCFEKFSEATFNTIVREIEGVYGKRVSTLSYGCGKVSYSDSLPRYVLGGRTSGYSSGKNNIDAITFYGDEIGRSFLKNNETLLEKLLKRPSGGRFYSDIQRNDMSIPLASAYTKVQVEKTIKNRGFYVNFMHWHDFYKSKNDSIIEGVKVMEPLFKSMHEAFQNNAYNSGLDYNEAVEYLYAKEALDSVKLIGFDNNTIEIQIYKSKKRDRDYSRIDTPISIVSDIKVLNGHTTLELSDQVPSAFLNKGMLLLNVVLDFETDHETIVLDLNGADEIEPLERKLTLSLVDKTTVMASHKAKFVLFRRKNGAQDYAVELVERAQSYSEKFNLPNLEDGYDYFCGAIDRKRESKIIAL